MKIEGKNAVYQVLNSKLTVNNLIVQEDLKEINQQIINLAASKHVQIQYLPKHLLDKRSDEGRHQGLIAYSEEFKYSEVEDMLEGARRAGKDVFLLLVDEVSDPHNLGSIIRSAECAGVDGIVIPKNRSCPVNDTVIKVSTGACFNVKIAMVTNLNDTIRELKKENIFIYSMEAGGRSVYQTDLRGNIAMIVGSEGFGVSSLTKKLSDEIISLPMFGEINSLNASVACGICLYEAVRQRNK